MMINEEKKKEVSLPISGYGGHVKGVRAKNMYGKSFRENSLASRKVMREEETLAR